MTILNYRNLLIFTVIILFLQFKGFCLLSNSELDLPTVTTNPITAITYTTSVSGGNVVSDGGAIIISQGICWSINQYPTIVDNKTSEISDSSIFTSHITELSPATTYYVRAYATNIMGTSYGNQISFTTNKPTVSEITISFENETILVGSKINANVEILDSDGELIKENILEWSSENTKIADVNNKGEITTNSYGEVEITAMYENVSAKAKLKVNRVYNKNYLQPSHDLQKSTFTGNIADIRFKNLGLPYGGAATCYLDINGDGIDDIFINPNFRGEPKRTKGEIYIYRNGEYILDNSYFKENQSSSMVVPRKAITGDFNNDSIPDIFVTGTGLEFDPYPIDFDPYPGEYTQILLSDGNGQYDLTEFKDKIGYYHGACSGDIDNDGDLDIFVLGFENTYFLINDGTGNFEYSTNEIDINILGGQYFCELVDVDKDGYLDLVLGGHDLGITDSTFSIPSESVGSTRIYWGSQFQKFDYNNLSHIPFVVNWGVLLDIDVEDIDGDEENEVLIARTGGLFRNGVINYFYNGWHIQIAKVKDRNATENTSELIEENTSDLGYEIENEVLNWMRVDDYDNNGKLDYFSAKREGEKFAIWEWDGKKLVRKLPITPKINEYDYTNTGKIRLTWESVSTDPDTTPIINEWLVFVSDNPEYNLTSRADTILVFSKDSKKESGLHQWDINCINKEMYVRIQGIDSLGRKSSMSKILKITIPPPEINSATICEGKTITINGANFIGVTKISVGGYNVNSFSYLSESTLYAVLNPNQSGDIEVNTVAGSVVYSDIRVITPPTQSFILSGSNSPLKGNIETYSVPYVEGVTFSWFFPNDWQQIQGSNTNQVSVKVGSLGGNISVVPSNICGSINTIQIPVSVYTHVPDNNFQQALRDLGIDKKNKPDSVLTESIMNLTKLNLSNSNIKDLTGIQDFESLTELDCSDNSLGSIDVTNNTLLKILYCNNAKLETLDVSQNLSLTELFCEDNQISNIDVSHNKFLSALFCGRNLMTSLDFSENNVLAWIACELNLITSINLSNNTNLIFLDCNSNYLTHLDVSNNPALSYFKCYNNQISNLDISKNTILEYFDCNDNKLTSLNLKNGNNVLISTMSAYNNPNLTCINVDNPELANTYADWIKDATASYSDNCVKTNIGLTELNRSIKVYPNPMTDELIIENLSGSRNNDFEIINAFGQSVLHEKFNEKTIIKTDILTPGIYVVRLKSGEMVKFEKVVKQ